jgi:hypothetical protein
MKEHTVHISDDIAFRISSDTKPSKWKTTDLQKGLRLIYHGTEAVGEGTGFGVPVLQYSSDLYFSGKSRLLVSHGDEMLAIRKEFLMDMVPTRTIRNSRIQSIFLLGFWRSLNQLYMKHRLWRFIIQMSISRRIGIRTRFAKVKPAGTVILTYIVKNNRIRVTADLRFVDKRNLQSVFLLNEQSSDLLRRYYDSNGVKLHDCQIGAWDTVKATRAVMTNANGGVGFRVSQVAGATLRRGREYLKGYQDWAGLDYAFIPNGRVTFEYDIETLKNDGRKR